MSIKRLLNIPKGYKIIDLKTVDGAIKVDIEAYKNRKAICSGCGKKHSEGYHGKVTVQVRDLPVCGQKVYLNVSKRRYRCPKDNKIYVEEIEWIKKRRSTNRFAKDVYRLTAIATNQEAGWYLGVDDEVIYRIDKSVLKELSEERLKPTPVSKNNSVDEVAWKKHHQYLTNVIDTDEKVVTWNEKGRTSEVLDHYYESLGEKNCRAIESVAMDGAKTFISSTKKNAINALIVLDRFHVAQKVANAVDQIRRNELSKARKNKNDKLIALTNCKQRFILLKKKKNLTKRQSLSLNKLCKINQPIYKALLLKEDFLQVYEFENVEAAEQHLYDWIDQALFSGLEPMFKFACSVLNKMQYILNWYKKKISSAISEGFNNKIKRLKRMAYGYRDIEYFKLKIHQHCGYLNPRRFPQ